MEKEQLPNMVDADAAIRYGIATDAAHHTLLVSLLYALRSRDPKVVEATFETAEGIVRQAASSEDSDLATQASGVIATIRAKVYEHPIPDQ